MQLDVQMSPMSQYLEAGVETEAGRILSPSYHQGRRVSTYETMRLLKRSLSGIPFSTKSERPLA